MSPQQSETLHTDSVSQSTPANRWALISLAMSMLLSSLGISSPNVALPAISQFYSASFAQVQWIIIAYLLAITVSIVTIGRLGDLYGHRRVLLFGLAGYVMSSLLCGIAPSLIGLIIARLLQGLSAATLMALTAALVRESVAKEQTGSAMGLLGTMSAIGTAAGPSLGGILISSMGWHAVFLVMAIPGMMAWWLGYRHLPRRVHGDAVQRNRKQFDYRGMLLLGVALATYALAVTIGTHYSALLVIALLSMALLVIIIFITVEKTAAQPLVNLQVFSDPSIRASLIMSVLIASVMMATLVVGPFYLTQSLHLSAAIAGLVMSVGPAISSLTGIPAGRLVDRYGAATVRLTGTALMVGGTLSLAILPIHLQLTGYIIAIVILTPGYQLFQAANNTLVMLEADAAHRGVISGMLSLSRNLGLISGASVMGAVFAVASGAKNLNTASALETTQGMSITFWVSGGLIMFALAIAVYDRFRLRHPSTHH